MALKKNLYGNVQLVGMVKNVDSSAFELSKAGKNNANWLQNVMNIRMDDTNGGSFFLNCRDGFDKTKPKNIYAKDENGNSLTIAFGDRFNETILEQVKNPPITVYYDKVEVDTHKEWKKKTFLTTFDLIQYLSQVIPDLCQKYSDGYKIKVVGNVAYSKYGEDKINENIEIKRIFFLTDNESEEEAKENQLGFFFDQQMLITKDSIDFSEWESEGIAKVNAFIYKSEYAKKEVMDNYVGVEAREDGKGGNYPSGVEVEYVIRANDEKAKETKKKVFGKFFNLDDNVVSCIKFSGRFVQGYLSKQITRDDLSDELLELIEFGIMTEEEVLKQAQGYSKDRINERQITKPFIGKDENGNAGFVYDNKNYTMEDLNTARMNSVVGKTSSGSTVSEQTVEMTAEEQDLMKELADLGL